ncbi:response regulator transcription factor [Pantoea sp. Mb-10]|uniref:response regulator transcription factor n=1 Tax=unclassified Pantoea TaxID=2630326 RepID=UPI001E2E1598|nr:MULTISPECIES: response regulator transcription factor [unclassified Pantoea]MCE0491889.1 response regulator transcription factor [Pantoea sp. Mb-10]MCE0503373.1 response regulator transcription factor [Pantoea sp. Pb-8]
MQHKRILIIEDDADAAEVLEAYLRRENYDVKLASDGLSGLAQAERWQPDLILLDVMLPALNGTEVLAKLRRSSDVPVIMVTAMGDTPDRIGALRYGADDYVVKPYHPGEVVARVQAVLRRSALAAVSQPDEVLRWQTLAVDTAAMMVTVTTPQGDLQRIDVTPTEFSLLVALMRAPVRALSRQTLLEQCLPESDALERVVDTHIYNLRRKLEAAGITDVLINVRGIGYRFRQP